MSDYSSLKATINANVKANNNHEITGSIMNSVLNAMVDSLGAGYQFMGVATPTNPGSAQTPDYKCFYLATTPGTYTYLGGLVVADGEVAILKYDTSWTKEVTWIATAAQVSQLGQDVNDINGLVIPISQRTVESWWLNVSAIQVRSDCGAVVIPVYGGESVKLTIGDSTGYYYVTKNIPTPLVEPEWATGYSGRSQLIDAESPKEFTLPSDAKYITIATKWFDTDCTPSSVIINGVDYIIGQSDIQTRVNNLEKNEDGKVIMQNIIGSLTGSGFTKTTNQDGSIRFSSDANVSGWKGINMSAIDTVKASTDYYLILDLVFVADALASNGEGFVAMKLLGGNNVPSTKYKVGNRTIIWSKVSSNSPTGCFVQMNQRLPGTWAAGAITFDVYHSALVEAKELSADEVISVLRDSDWAVKLRGLETANFVLHNGAYPEIDCWGDSLTAAAYGYTGILSQLSGLKCNMHGYGGKTSQYIRAQFEAGYNPNNFNIFWVGRNNYLQFESVLDDLKAMVSKLNNPNFLVIMPPNGGYGTFGGVLGELKGGDAYDAFIKIEKLLKNAFGGHFFNIREAVISRWSQGISLLSAFTQPAVGSNVQISVSDSAALTTYNTFDVSQQGTSFMEKIVIGINGQYDIYSVVSVDDSTHLTVKLEESNRIAPGNTVENVTEDDYTLMLRVEQYADYMFREYDSTLSTYRIDGVHPTPTGRELNAQLIWEALWPQLKKE